jgi:hypothetical protein
MDLIALIVTAALILVPLQIYLHNRRVRAAAADEPPRFFLVARYSVLRILGLITPLLFIELFAIIQGYLTFISTRRGVLAGEVFWLAMGLLCGWFLLLWCYRLLLCTREDVLTIDARGVCDVRVIAQMIPWCAVKDVREERSRGGSLVAVTLMLDSTQTDSLDQIYCARITAAGLDIAPSTLLAAIQYHLAAERKSPIAGRL